MRDHFVSRFHIRQFCNDDGRVFCLDKRKLVIPDRAIGNMPKDILHGSSLYTDHFGNLDEELYKPIENTFAPHLVRLIHDPTTSSQQPGFRLALLDWIAAQYSKTALLSHITSEILKKHHSDVLTDTEGLLVLQNTQRLDHFKMLKRVMAKPKWKWRIWRSNGTKKFVLGDHPICHTQTGMDMGFMLFIPLAPKLMLCGGSAAGHEVVRKRNISRGINRLIVSWCNRYVYSDSLSELDSLVDMMQPKDDPKHDEWIRYARHPHHGVAIRVKETDPPPGDYLHSLEKLFD